ncbi:MAG: peptidoglycan editing factor PgeF [Bacillota bacterium]
MKIIKANGTEYLAFDNITSTNLVKHCFTTRIGGVSEGVFASLNLGRNRGDSDENVFKNYDIIQEAVGFTPKSFVTAKQTHGTNVFHAKKEHAGMGLYSEHTLESIDGMITNEVGLPILIFGADCVPVYYVDTKQKAIGLAHCGWEGTGKRMAEVTLQAMIDTFGTNPKDVVAGIGPSISQSCFQIDQPVIDLFEKNIDFYRDYLKEDPSEQGKFLMDLWGMNAQLLRNMGVESIEISGLCTVCETEFFFSHRGMGDNRGSMAGIMELKG